MGVPPPPPPPPPGPIPPRKPEKSEKKENNPPERKREEKRGSKRKYVDQRSVEAKKILPFVRLHITHQCVTYKRGKSLEDTLVRAKL